MFTTPAAFLWSISISAAALTPATLTVVRLSNVGDNPFKNVAAILKIALAWWLGGAISAMLGHYVFFAFGPVFALTAYPAIIGGFLHLFFGEDFWRCTWWAFASLGLLVVVFVAAQIVLGRYGLGVW